MDKIILILPFICAFLLTLLNLYMSYRCAIEEIRKFQKGAIFIILIAAIVTLLIH